MSGSAHVVCACACLLTTCPRYRPLGLQHIYVTDKMDKVAYILHSYEYEQNFHKHHHEGVVVTVVVAENTSVGDANVDVAPAGSVSSEIKAHAPG